MQRSASGHSSRYAGSNSVQFVGKRITVFWEGDGRWYSGTIKEYNPAGAKHLVKYDDGDQHSEDLGECTWDFEGEQPANGAGTVADEVPTEAGGLKLHRSKSGSTGYRHVYPDRERFRARVKSAKQQQDLGVFDTAVEAAVAVAKKLQEPTQSLVTEAQGLKLQLSTHRHNTTGYRGVSFEADRNVFRAATGKARLGTFKTAVEAAVAVARRRQEEEEEGVDELEEEEEEEELVTEAEGLKLRLSGKSRTGYRHVIDEGSRFRAKATGKFQLGSYVTAVEAATAVARWYLQDDGNGGEGDDEAEDEEDEDEDVEVVTTEAEGLKLRLSGQNKTGYLHVTRTGVSRFRAELRGHGRQGAPLTLGHYGTAVEAAVAVARHLQAVEEEEEEEEGEEEEVVAEADGIKLHLSPKNKTGYLGITVRSRFGKTIYEANPYGQWVGSFASAVEAAVAIAKHLQAKDAPAAAMEEESEEDELEVKEEDEVAIEVEDEEEIKEAAEQPVPEEQPGPLPDPPQPQQLPGQPPGQPSGQQPESAPQLEVAEQPLPQRPSVALGVAVGVAVLTLGQRLAQLESRLGTDAPQGANVLQRIKTLEVNTDVTAIGSMPDRIAALEAKAAEWLV